MNLTFIELPPFERFRTERLSDEAYRTFQNELLQNPEKGELIQHTHGLRKIRLPLENKGKQGGARAIYYYIVHHSRILLITAYSKNRKEDLTREHYKILTDLVAEILEAENE